MNIKDLFKELSLFDGHYKRAAVDEAIGRREEVIPHLLTQLEEVLADPLPYAKDGNFFGHIYAVQLLGHFKEERAHGLIVDLFSLPEDLCDRLFGDTVTEDLPNLLLNTCGGRFDAIRSLAENRKADAYCRGSALRAMAYGVVTGDLDRAEAIAYFLKIISNQADEPPSNFFDEAASCLLDLYPEESMAQIEEAFENGLINPGYVSLRNFENQLALGREATLDQLAQRWEMRNPDDFHQRMQWWACFRATEEYESYVHKSKRQRKKKSKTRRKMAKASRQKGRKKK